MTRNTTLLIVLLATLALVIVMLITNSYIPTKRNGELNLNAFKDAATTLAFIGGAAMGIDVFWKHSGPLWEV